MGLFGFIGKVAGKVAKAGLSVATKGLSDKVFSALKGKGAKPAATKQTAAPTIQNQALMAKLGAPVVKLSQTEAGEGGYVASALRRRRSRKRRKATSSGTSKRKPPTGGLDLKALSASWKAAGKPGSWQEWIATHK